MNLSLRIALRYLFSKKKTNAINIISGVSATAIGVGAMALVLVLSVFNGLEDLVKSLYTVFYPEVMISAKYAKSFNWEESYETILKQHPNVAHFSKTLEENALLEYGGQQHIATLKGVDDNYFKVVGRFDTFLIQGNSKIQTQNSDFLLLGAGIAYRLNLNTAQSLQPVAIYMAKKSAKSLSSPENAFQKTYIYTCGAFVISDEFDTKYGIVPLDFFQQLTENYNSISSVELKLKNYRDIEKTIKELQHHLGSNFSIQSRYEQNEILYKVLTTEKWIVFLILSFIVAIASFNITGALTLLVLDKKQDIAILSALGYYKDNIQHLFLSVGILLGFIGTFIGILIGIFLLLLQKYIGIVPMPGSTFLIEFYPVKILALDVIIVMLIVFIISFIAAYLPAKYASKNIEQDYLGYLN